MKRLTIIISLCILAQLGMAQDPNFHIYLCFGQSNMEGQGAIESQDKIVDDRFQVLQSLDCSNIERDQNTWHPAIPPLTNCSSGLSPADYFGRTMVKNLPNHIEVGVINVAVGGCDIRLFDKNIYQDYDDTYTESWFTDKIEAYGGNPYEHLLKLAQVAQQKGVIKGILLHQGETNTGDNQWPSYVKTVYDNLITDLSLDPNTPLLAGEVYSGEDNCCSSMNPIINTLPQTITSAHVISSEDCSGQDNAHFNSEGYRILGQRYAEKMLTLIEYDKTEVLGIDSNQIKSDFISFECYPNPTNQTTNISFFITQTSNVSIKLISLAGAEVASILDKELVAGEHIIQYQLDSLDTGVYYYIMKVGNQSSKQKVIIE